MPNQKISYINYSMVVVFTFSLNHQGTRAGNTITESIQPEELAVFGDDYPTPDGTGVRDYIHVVDLADGHLKALDYLAGDARDGVHTYNLGTGTGYSVLDMVKAFEKASGRPVPYRIAPRRSGDIAECWAEPDKAFNELKWKAELGLDRMMADSWRWQSRNPNGYRNS